MSGSSFVLPEGMMLKGVPKKKLGCGGCVLSYQLSGKLHHAGCMDEHDEVTSANGLKSCVGYDESTIFILVPVAGVAA